jgi:opacity protein-like surface antigen
MVTIVAVVYGLLLASVLFGAENDPVTKSSDEVAVLGGYGITHRGYGATRTQVMTVDMVLRYGHFLSGEVGAGTWYQGRHEILLEIPYHLAVDHDGRSMVGVNVLGSWKFTGMEEITPYLFAGGGLVYVDLGLPTMGTRINGNYQAGGGIQRFVGKDVAVMGEYRYHHISNAGTAHPNEPLNSSKFLIGVSFYH